MLSLQNLRHPALLFCLSIAFVPQLGLAIDTDKDGVPDAVDNCTLVGNPDQRDTNLAADDDSSLEGRQRYGNRCDADFNDDGSVDVSDFSNHFLPCYAKGLVQNYPECASSDFDGNGVVSFQDFAFSFLPQFIDGSPGPGRTLTPYAPDECVEDLSSEATRLNVQSQGPLGDVVADPALSDRIALDLCWMRREEPSLASEMAASRWNPSSLLVALDGPVPSAELEALNATWQATQMEELCPICGNNVIIDFAQQYNIEALAEIYAQAEGVLYAEPDWLIGNENFYEYEDIGGGEFRWRVDDGFLDCFDTCDCHRDYTFQVSSSGHVALVDYREYGMWWCEF